MDIDTIAVIGLGAMGTALAKRLIDAGYRLTGFDIVRQRTAAMACLGLKAAGSAGEAAQGSDLVVLSLPNWEIVRGVVEDGIGKVLRPGQIVIDTSTVPPWETRAMAERLAEKGVEWLDVPISGAANQAREGNMVFMVGGNRSVFERIKPVLDRIGKKTVYVGKNGDAAMLKLVVNLTLFLNQGAAIEGLVLGSKAGLPAGIMLDVLVSGSAGSDLLAARGRDMLAGNFEPKGPVWLAVKDLGLALESARRLGVVLPLAGLYQQLLLTALFAGLEQEDATAVMKTYERLAGSRRAPREES